MSYLLEEIDWLHRNIPGAHGLPNKVKIHAHRTKTSSRDHVLLCFDGGREHRSCRPAR